MATKSRLFIRQSVIGLGFLSGFFTAIGIDPEEEVIGILGSTVTALYPDPRIGYLFLLLPSILLVLSIITAYRLGGFAGFISVIMAYFSGLTVFVSLFTAVILLGVAIVMGYLSANRRLLGKIRF